MKIALMFPGQGAQSPGFLRELPDNFAVRETLQEASAWLGCDVLALDTEVALASTISTQIGLVVAGAAFSRFLSAYDVSPAAVAGMSVGVYSAAIAAGAIDLLTALTLVRRRAELMEAAFPGGSHGMMVIDGLRMSAVKQLVAGSSAVIANYNSATQHVVAGGVWALGPLVQRALDAGAHTARMLRMSVASHTPELLHASEELLTLAQSLPVATPRIPVYSSRNARPLTTAQSIREELAQNMANPVRWHDTLIALDECGTTLLMEAPPGHTLTRLASATLPDTRCLTAGELRWDVIVRSARRNQ